MSSFHYRKKSGKKGSARNHVAYIMRLGRYGDRDDLIYSSHGNLPAWANGDPLTFWAAADKHERANAAAYREHEIALPNELNVDQTRELADRLAAELVGPKPYVLAVHSRLGSLGGLPNTHIHLDCSDRLPDGIERDPARTFARYNHEHPERGGCRKDSGGKAPLALKNDLVSTRKKVADLQNEALEKAGFTARVDHRSLRDQGSTREPERHLGPAKVNAMSEADIGAFRGRRRK